MLDRTVWEVSEVRRLAPGDVLVLVGYASAHGSTRGVAERIAAGLDQMGCHVELRPLRQVTDVRGYDVVVLGSAVHNGAWLPTATEFVRRNSSALAERRVYTFSVGTLGEQSTMVSPVITRLLRSLGESKKITAIKEMVHPVDHHRFAGALAPAHYSFIGRLLFRAMGGRFGDHRNWPEIDAWAEHVGHELATGQRRPAT